MGRWRGARPCGPGRPPCRPDRRRSRARARRRAARRAAAPGHRPATQTPQAARPPRRGGRGADNGAWCRSATWQGGWACNGAHRRCTARPRQIGCERHARPGTRRPVVCRSVGPLGHPVGRASRTGSKASSSPVYWVQTEQVDPAAQPPKPSLLDLPGAAGTAAVRGSTNGAPTGRLRGPSGSRPPGSDSRSSAGVMRLGPSPRSSAGRPRCARAHVAGLTEPPRTCTRGRTPLSRRCMPSRSARPGQTSRRSAEPPIDLSRIHATAHEICNPLAGVHYRHDAISGQGGTAISSASAHLDRAVSNGQDAAGDDLPSRDAGLPLSIVDDAGCMPFEAEGGQPAHSARLVPR
jgi:hypothetical protein